MAAKHILSLLLASTALACATPRQTPKDCRARAEAEYRRCINPQFRQSGAPVEPVRSDASQACSQSYQQALDACRGPVEAPVPEIKTSTSS